MIYDWFKIFNKTEFDAEELVSKTYTLIFEGIGQVEILVTQGETLGVLYDGVFLSVNMSDENPFEFDGHAVYLDSASQDVYLGIEVDEP